jgi:glycosyltransferase involved in cell wall biosynthesis
MKKGAARLLFYSHCAFFPQLYAVFELLRSRFGVQGFVITDECTEVPKVYSPSGSLTYQSAGLSTLPDFVTSISASLTKEGKSSLLRKKILEIAPDFIWVHEEPNDFFVNQILQWFPRSGDIRIVGSVAENMWHSPGGYRERWAKWRRRRLWRRYDGILACATKSAESIRNYGMPDTVPVSIAWLPNLPPPKLVERNNGVALPSKTQNEFFIGFAGRITAAKGWRVLLAALTQLPDHFKCLIAGTGEEETELRLWCQLPVFRGRVHCLGVMEKRDLWSFYGAIDVFVLPSITVPQWTEQFGFVLAEAMACGVPVVGSNSGAIPEVIGGCGIVVEENDPAALAQALRTLADDPSLRVRFAEQGLLRFDREFTVSAYASKVAELLGLKGPLRLSPSAEPIPRAISGRQN